MPDEGFRIVPVKTHQSMTAKCADMLHLEWTESLDISCVHRVALILGEVNSYCKTTWNSRAAVRMASEEFRFDS